MTYGMLGASRTASLVGARVCAPSKTVFHHGKRFRGIEPRQRCPTPCPSPEGEGNLTEWLNIDPT